MIAALALALAAAAPPPPLAGLYVSHAMEVGAALELTADHRFRYQLDYGAVSEQAEGRWTRDKSHVYLTATRMTGQWNVPAFRREPLAIDGDRLILERYERTIPFEREPTASKE